MADDALKSIAQRKIRQLEKEDLELRAKLSDKQSFNKSAWEEYGSELCSGSMLKDEADIRGEIDLVRRKILLLRRFVTGKLDISREDRLVGNAGEVSEQIRTLQNSLKLIEGELAEIEEVRSLLN